MSKEETCFHNFYYCPTCDVSWEDDWSCACDDDCPECGISYSPEKSEEVPPENNTKVIVIGDGYKFDKLDKMLKDFAKDYPKEVVSPHETETDRMLKGFDKLF